MPHRERDDLPCLCPCKFYAIDKKKFNELQENLYVAMIGGISVHFLPETSHVLRLLSPRNRLWDLPIGHLVWPWRWHLAVCRYRGLRQLAAAPGQKSSSPSDQTPPGQSILTGFIEQIIRDQLKAEYVDDDDWGKTRRTTVGYQIKGKPFEWDLKHRKKEVNDGLWEKYKVRLVDPEDHLHVQISQLEMHEGRIAFALSMTAKLAGDARLERWRKGIKMLNTHVEADGTLEISLAGEVGFKIVADNGLPAVAIEPVITKIDLKLRKFDLQRISKLDGIAAHELGEGVKDTIQKELNRREPKIVAKLNKSIEKRKDKLRLSPAEFARTGWSKLQESVAGE